MVLGYDDDWPTATLINRNPISVEFVCGYTTGANVPDPIKLAIKMQIAHYYENREAVTVLGAGQGFHVTPQAVLSLLTPYRVFAF